MELGQLGYLLLLAIKYNQVICHNSLWHMLNTQRLRVDLFCLIQLMLLHLIIMAQHLKEFILIFMLLGLMVAHQLHTMYQLERKRLEHQQMLLVIS